MLHENSVLPSPELPNAYPTGAVARYAEMLSQKEQVCKLERVKKRERDEEMQYSAVNTTHFTRELNSSHVTRGVMAAKNLTHAELLHVKY